MPDCMSAAIACSDFLHTSGKRPVSEPSPVLGRSRAGARHAGTRRCAGVLPCTDDGRMPVSDAACRNDHRRRAILGKSRLLHDVVCRDPMPGRGRREHDGHQPGRGTACTWVDHPDSWPEGPAFHTRRQRASKGLRIQVAGRLGHHLSSPVCCVEIARITTAFHKH